MRIGELEDTAGKEFVARKAAMTAELARTGTRLAEPQPATAPAVPLSDSVHISPEAHEAWFGRPVPLEAAPGPFPSPAGMVAILREIAAQPPGQALPEAVSRLARFVQQLAARLPGRPPSMAPGATETTATAVLRLLGSPNPSPEAVHALVRQLVAQSSTAGARAGGPPARATFERAAGALVFAILRMRTERGPGPLAAETRPVPFSPAAGVPAVLVEVASLPPGQASPAAVARLAEAIVRLLTSPSVDSPASSPSPGEPAAPGGAAGTTAATLVRLLAGPNAAPEAVSALVRQLVAEALPPGSQPGFPGSAPTLERAAGTLAQAALVVRGEHGAEVPPAPGQQQPGLGALPPGLLSLLAQPATGVRRRERARRARDRAEEEAPRGDAPPGEPEGEHSGGAYRPT